MSGPTIAVYVGDGNRERVSADCLPHAALCEDVGEGPVAIVVIEDVFAALQSRWPTCHLNAFVGAAGYFWKRGGLDVEVDIVGDKEVEVPVAVIVEKGAAGVPSILRL